MKNTKSPIAVFLLLVCSSLCPAQIGQQDIQSAIDQAAQYLVRHCRENGQFVYRVNLDPRVTVRPRYNILRHAGAIYALTQFQQATPSDRVRKAIARASDFLLSQTALLADVPETAAVWSDPRINGTRDPRRAKLGGTGLGLAALCQVELLYPDSIPVSRLRQLGDFLLFMQRDDGGFYSFYHPGAIGRDDRWTSLYYPGEAALGLLMLNEVVADSEWVRGAREALLYLADQRKDQTSIPADHWALMATAKQLSCDEDLSQAQRFTLSMHARQIVKSMLQEQLPQKGNPNLDGCFTPDGRTTPTATRLEGLIPAVALFADEPPLRMQVEDAIHRGVVFLLKCQVRDGVARGGIPRARQRLPKESDDWSTEFNARATEVRIDYVQHAMCAWMAYSRQFAAKASEDQ